jgi:hypothetical protein
LAHLGARGDTHHVGSRTAFYSNWGAADRAALSRSNFSFSGAMFGIAHDAWRYATHNWLLLKIVGLAAVIVIALEIGRRVWKWSLKILAVSACIGVCIALGLLRL